MDDRAHEPFEVLVERVLDGLPRDIGRLLDNVAVVIEEEPSRDQLRESGMKAGETLYGLYEGTPAIEYASDWVPLPNKISLFRLPLRRTSLTPTNWLRRSVGPSSTSWPTTLASTTNDCTATTSIDTMPATGASDELEGN